MPDYDPSIADRHAGPPRRGRRLAALALLVLIGACSAPLALDGAKLVGGQWAAILGPKPLVDTPALDRVASGSARIAEEFRRLVRRSSGLIRPGKTWAIGGLAFSLVAGAALLHYSRIR